ncbi:MAG: DUF4180 domain-containing protein [Chloroflexi bacterium]|nr:DUF4180 domain-containing protein [Chloroflexota bacterium]
MHERGGNKIAEIVSADVFVNNVQDALDWMATANYEGAESLILHEAQLHPDFFDLSTKLAGDILLKFSMYRMKLAVIGDFDKFESNALKAFIRESNRGKQFFFVSGLDSAITKLTG